MSRSILLISAILVTARAATASGTNLPIISGEVVTIDEIPFQVAILSRTSGHFCGGSLIGSRWVLTAAHCVEDSNLNNLRVRVGSSYHAKGGKVVRIVRRIIHPDWNGSVRWDNDFALLKLGSWGFAAKNTVPLANASEPVTEGTFCTASGWGSTESSSKSDKLRAVQVPLADQRECRENYADRGITVTVNMICAGYPEGGKDTCGGDSGGPLTCNGKLFGVTSFGIGCAEEGYYGVYAFVPAASDWIREQTGI